MANAARVVRLLDEEAHATAIEKREIAAPEEMAKPERVFIERLRDVDVPDRERIWPIRFGMAR